MSSPDVYEIAWVQYALLKTKGTPWTKLNIDETNLLNSYYDAVAYLFDAKFRNVNAEHFDEIKRYYVLSGKDENGEVTSACLLYNPIDYDVRKHAVKKLFSDDLISILNILAIVKLEKIRLDGKAVSRAKRFIEANTGYLKNPAYLSLAVISTGNSKLKKMLSRFRSSPEVRPSIIAKVYLALF